MRVRADGSRRCYLLERGPLAEVDAWPAPYRWMWDGRLAVTALVDRPVDESMIGACGPIRPSVAALHRTR